MSTEFIIQSSDLSLLDKATRIAIEFAQPYIRDEIVGIVFLGAIVRGYFDHSADIDIAIFKKQSSQISIPGQFLKVDGFEIHCHLADYESELTASWNMAKRWAYSHRQIYFDPDSRISRLLEEKVPLKPEEKKWLLMSGCCLSEWYINRLSLSWVERGNLTSAQYMFNEGLNYFFNMLFALNNQVVADIKWRYYCAERLTLLPSNFQERIKETMILNSFSVEEIERRRAAFMEMWQEMLPMVENEVQMSYDEINRLV
jgi:hypothetical protein